MRIVKVYGPLAKFLGQRSFKADVRNPGEAIRFLLANFPRLEGHMSQHDYKISVGRLQLPIADHPEYIHLPSGSNEPIRIIPVVAGAGQGVGQIFAGIGLIALSFLLPGAQIGLFGLGQIGLTALAAPVAGIGISLALSGISQLISPTTTMSTGVDSDFDPRKSYSFSGIQNTNRQGVPVPIVYGEVLVGSIIVSAGIDVEPVAN